MKVWIPVFALVFAAGCGMSDSDIRQKAGDAAVSTKHFLDGASDQAKEAFNAAAEKAKDAAQSAGKQLDDSMLRAKVLAGFKLVAGLDASNISVEAKSGVVTLTGTVPTELDKMKATGVAFGVTGSLDKVNAKLEVKG